VRNVEIGAAAVEPEVERVQRVGESAVGIAVELGGVVDGLGEAVVEAVEEVAGATAAE